MPIPERSRPVDDVIAELRPTRRRRALGRRAGRSASCTTAARPCTRSAERAATLFLHERPQHARLPVAGAIQSDVVRWTADLLHGPSTAAGFLTSGGTESIQCAVLAARERGRIERGITDPEIVLAESAHAAFHKSAHMFGMRTITTPGARRLDRRRRRDGRPRSAPRHGARRRARRRSTRRASSTRSRRSPSSPRRSTPTATSTRAWAASCCRSPSCWAATVPPWDFRVEGVHSISADVHKLGYAPKGVSVIIHRTRELRRFQTFVFDGWLGGLYASPNLQGTRSGAPMAAAWAVMAHLGDGRLRRADRAGRSMPPIGCGPAIASIDGGAGARRRDVPRRRHGSRSGLRRRSTCSPSVTCSHGLAPRPPASARFAPRDGEPGQRGHDGRLPGRPRRHRRDRRPPRSTARPATRPWSSAGSVV